MKRVQLINEALDRRKMIEQDPDANEECLLLEQADQIQRMLKYEVINESLWVYAFT